MAFFIAQAIDGCALGALYALFGIGLGLVFSTMGILNAAQGCYATFGAIAALFAADDFAMPFPVAVAVGMGFAAFVAVLVDLVGFAPLRRRGGGPAGALITSVAVWIILDGLAGFATGQQSLTFPAGTAPSAVLHIGSAELPLLQIVTLLALVLVTFGVHVLVTRTRFGAAMRAVGHSPAAAAIAGVNARRIAVWTALLAGGISGLAGVLAGIATSNISFTLGQGLMLRGFAAVAIGGPADVRGIAIAGLALGVFEGFAAPYVSGGLRDGLVLALLLGFLVLRPRGVLRGAGFTRA
jgi:branched-chain amino acid transport system permease protein